ncbi:hypothetical protein SAMN05660923_02895 [Tepidimicrobium xylanilyticum]|uniref:Uncharacterized protein n=1 Tax=Tepidimicrobium xylanilyticum TaxID=1123352 RepID=A0A1H3EG72_9FIRM|nr:hypothetical protein SAMN05660923_02895 [Tepidimicrobium xylanilyticum]
MMNYWKSEVKQIVLMDGSEFLQNLLKMQKKKGILESGLVLYAWRQKRQTRKAMKKILYQKCRRNYDLVYGRVNGLVYENIPYGTDYLSVYYMRPQSPKGTVLIYGYYHMAVIEILWLLIQDGMKLISTGLIPLRRLMRLQICYQPLINTGLLLLLILYWLRNAVYIIITSCL